MSLSPWLILYGETSVSHRFKTAERRPARRVRTTTKVGSRKARYLLPTILLIITISLIAIHATHAEDPAVKQSAATSPLDAPSFGYSFQWGSYGGPIKPAGISTDSAGNLFVADARNYEVVKFASNGSFLSAWGSFGSGPGQFKNPEGIALDPSGNVYVSDSVNNNVQKFSGTGSFLTAWNTWNTTNTLKSPLGITVNGTGFVYLVDQGDHLVEIFRNDGTYVSSFGGIGSNLVGKFQTPFGVALAGSNVYVSDSGSGNLTEFTKTGSFVCFWNSGLLQPDMVAADSSADLYVTDGTLNDVAKFSPCNSKAAWISGTLGSAPGQFNGPVGIAVNNSMNVFVGDSNNNRVQTLSASTGGYISTLTYPRFGLFDSLFDLTFDNAGHILVADQGNNRIQEFSVTGSFLLSWSINESSGGGGVFDPFGIAVDHNGNVYVADAANSRVEKFTSTGSFIRDLGTGTRFVTPYSVTVDSSNNVYVTDYDNSTVQKFDSSGNRILQWGQASGNCQFTGPTGIVADSLGNLYVSDSGNNRIEKCSSSGALIASWGSPGAGNLQFNFPSHLSLDSSGNLYVADSFNSRIQEITSSGFFVATFGVPGSGNGQLLDPRGLAVDSSGRVFVADTGNSVGTTNNRVEVFSASSPQPAIGGGAHPMAI